MFVNTTISVLYTVTVPDVIKKLRFGKSDDIDNLYLPVFLHTAVIPIPENAKPNLSSTCI